MAPRWGQGADPDNAERVIHRAGRGRRRPDRCRRCVYVPERWGGRPGARRSRGVTRGGRWAGSPWPSGRIWMVLPASRAQRTSDVAPGVLRERQRGMFEWRASCLPGGGCGPRQRIVADTTPQGLNASRGRPSSFVDACLVRPRRRLRIAARDPSITPWLLFSLSRKIGLRVTELTVAVERSGLSATDTAHVEIIRMIRRREVP
jgi:hypothetical protein